MKPYRYLNELKHDVRPRLMGFASPAAVRASALRLLENRPASDFLYRHAMKDCPGYAPLNQLLQGWNKEGHWGIDRLYMRLKGEDAAWERAMKTAVRNLHHLMTYLWNGKGGRLKKTAKNLLAGSEKSGFVSFVKGNSLRRELDHWGGYAVEALVSYGIEDERIGRFFQYLVENQRDDGGWLPAPLQKELGPGGESHPLHTVAFARAMAADEKWSNSNEFKKAVDFLLSICFQELPHHRKFKTEGWKTFSWPCFGYSALEIFLLAVDAAVDHEDERLQKVLKWLVGEQDKDSLWKATVKRKLYPGEEMFLTMVCAGSVKELLDDREED